MRKNQFWKCDVLLSKLYSHHLVISSLRKWKKKWWLEKGKERKREREERHSVVNIIIKFAVPSDVKCITISAEESGIARSLISASSLLSVLLWERTGLWIPRSSLSRRYTHRSCTTTPRNYLQLFCLGFYKLHTSLYYKLASWNGFVTCYFSNLNKTTTNWRTMIVCSVW